MNADSPPSILWRLFALEPNQLTPLERTLMRTSLLVGVFVLFWTYLDVRTNPADDLRNRVVGARVMLAGYEPYHFDWQPGMPEEWLDPVYDPKARRLTLSPPMLLPYAVMAPAPFKLQRFISFVAEWLAMIASLCLLARSLPAPRHRVIFLLGAVVFVIASDYWRIHLERGQMYVFVLLALSVAIYAAREHPDSIACGIAFGMLALMRPNLLCALPALVLVQRWRCAGAMAATVTAGVVAASALLPWSSWPGYLTVGDQYFAQAQDYDAMPDIPRPAHEGPVEGVWFYSPMTNFRSNSFAPIYRFLDQWLQQFRVVDQSGVEYRYGLPDINLALTSKVAMVSLAALLCGLAWLRRGAAPHSLTALIIVLSMDTEYFLPIRWGYADVVLLAPLALLLPVLLEMEGKNQWLLAVVLLGLLSGPLGQLFFSLDVATVLRSWMVMGGLTALAVFGPSSSGARMAPGICQMRTPASTPQ